MFTEQEQVWLGRGSFIEGASTQGASWEAQGFTLIQSQLSQFQSLHEHLKRQHWGVVGGITLLDFGAGLGQLLAYLVSQQVNVLKYTPIDIVPEFVDAACAVAENLDVPVQRVAYPEAPADLPRADVIACLSVLSSWTGPEYAHRSMTKRTLQTFAAKAGLGFSVSFASAHADWHDRHQQPVSLDWLAEQASHISERYWIDKGEAPHLLTLHVSHEPSRFRQAVSNRHRLEVK